jgi:hypothetical protein
MKYIAIMFVLIVPLFASTANNGNCYPCQLDALFDAQEATPADSFFRAKLDTLKVLTAKKDSLRDEVIQLRRNLVYKVEVLKRDTVKQPFGPWVVWSWFFQVRPFDTIFSHTQIDTINRK